MDKNKIHIDDLVRSRLSGAEEREPAGAWSAMRDLLDKEMPVETAAFNWRRMLGYTTALLLAASVSMGGYNYYRHASMSYSNHSAISTVAAPVSTSNAHQTNPANHIPALADHAANSQSITLDQPSSSGKPVAEHRSAIASGKHAVTPHTQNTPSIAATEPVAVAEPTSTQASSAARQETSTAALVASSNSSPAKPAAAISAQELHASTPEASKPASPADQPKHTPHQVAVQREQSMKPAPQEQLMPAAGSGLTTGEGTKGQPAFVLRKDTIRQIEIVYHRVPNTASRSLQYIKDTIAITNLVVDRREPLLAPKPQPKDAAQPRLAVARPSVPAPAKPVTLAKASSSPAAAAPANPVPQAAAASSAEAAAAGDNIRLVSLSQFRVASRFSKFWNSEHFLLMVQNVKTDLSRAQFYAGITGGLNASLFTSTAMAGFQAGLAGLLTFSDQWSLAGELKFYQRFNTGNSIKDNYVAQDGWAAGDYSTVNGVSYRQWSWRQDTVAHSYNFTTVQTLELPLLLRYNAGRFFAEAGINMMYAFAVNADEIEKPYGNPSLMSKQMPATFTPESVSGNKPGINVSDFGSRFGLGYALGVGYEITPALQCNMRLVHNIWDNAAGVGAQKVSQYLYQTPSIQLSVGYRFKQGKGR